MDENGGNGKSFTRICCYDTSVGNGLLLYDI